ncbi:MAG: hypothetical protein GTN40_03180 [Candidatus Aenigmarchaeota archaeon]|nr:hypothetical protein [Candidatus Aenigmarchaeota archaeon]
MYVFGVYISVVDLLMIFSGFVVLLILYLAYEIKKLKKLEVKLALIESKMEEEEKELVRDIQKIGRYKKIGRRLTKRAKKKRR